MWRDWPPLIPISDRLYLQLDVMGVAKICADCKGEPPPDKPFSASNRATPRHIVLVCW